MPADVKPFSTQASWAALKKTIESVRLFFVFILALTPLLDVENRQHVQG